MPPERRLPVPRGIGVFGLAVALEVALVFLLPIFVTVDGAAHVGAAAALWTQLTGSSDPVARYTTLHWAPFTNLIPEVPMAILGGVLGLGLAEKLMIGSYVIGLPVAAIYAVSGVRPDARWLAVIAVPLTFNLTLTFGFFSFCYALIGFLVLAGYCVRHGDDPGARHTLALAALATLIYVAHAFVFAEAVLFLTVLTIAGWWVMPARTLGNLGRRLLRTAVVALPGVLLLALAFLDRQGLAAGRSTDLASLFAPQPLAVIETAVLVHPLVSFDQREAVFAVALAVLMVGLTLAAIRRRSRLSSAALGYAAFIVLLVIQLGLINPSGTFWSGGPGGFLSQRLALIAALASMPMLAALGPPPRRVLVTSVALVAAAGIVLIRLPTYVALSGHAAAFPALAECVAPNATFAQVNLGGVPLASRRTDPLRQEAGRLAAAANGWDLGNVETAIDIFPLRNVAALDPYVFLRSPGGLPETVEPVIDPLGFEARTGGSVDYVLVFGRPALSAEVETSASWIALRGQLEAAYRHVLTTDVGWLEVWERTPSAVAELGAARRAASPACAGFLAP